MSDEHLSPAFAARFAAEWIAAWNAHDVDAVLRHYHDDCEMSSPSIAKFSGEATGVLRGKAAVEAYWRRALAALPGLHFELQSVLLGVRSLVIHYHSHRGPASEVFFFDDDGLVVRAAAHYVMPLAVK